MKNRSSRRSERLSDVTTPERFTQKHDRHALRLYVQLGEHTNDPLRPGWRTGTTRLLQGRSLKSIFRCRARTTALLWLFHRNIYKELFDGRGGGVTSRRYRPSVLSSGRSSQRRRSSSGHPCHLQQRTACPHNTRGRSCARSSGSCWWLGRTAARSPFGKSPKRSLSGRTPLSPRCARPCVLPRRGGHRKRSRRPPPGARATSSGPLPLAGELQSGC